MAKTNVDLEKTENMDELVEKELATMENTSVENVLHLTKTVMYNGEEVTELAFDFDKLTGADALNIEEELVSRGTTALSTTQIILSLWRPRLVQSLSAGIFSTRFPSSISRG